VLPFGTSFLAIASALVLPTLVSLLLVSAAARRVNARYLAAFAAGIYLWFFSDTIGDSAYLGVNSGFGGGVEQAALVVLFILGVLLVFSLDRTAFGSGDGDGLAFRIPVLVALAVGIHGFGEAAAFSGVAASTPATDLLDAFGGLSPAVAFILHKALEPTMVGAAYWLYSRNHSKSTGGLLKDMLILTVAFVLPGLVGAATNYYLSFDVTYVFALGLGTSIYAVVMLAKPLFSGAAGSRWESTKLACAIVLGFLCLYFAALLHS
jgi:hypothetical protein